MLGGCSVIEPGHAGIKVHMYGSKKGVDFEPVGVGRVFFNPMTERIYEYPTFMQTTMWTREDTNESPGNEEVSFNTKEGMVITSDVSISYTLKAEGVPAFFQKFRTDNLHAFTHGFVRNVARDSFNEIGSRYTVEQAYGESKEEILAAVKEKINAQLSPYQVIIEQFGYIGAPRLPEAVVSALNAKIQATQEAIRVENELRASEAEARKQIAKAEGESKSILLRAEGQAKANEILSRSLTPTLIQYKALDEWDGKLPQITGGATPFVNLTN